MRGWDRVTTNNLICTIHKESLVERLSGEKLTPLCVSCQTEIEHPEDLAQYEVIVQERNQLWNVIAKYVKTVFYFLSMIIVLAIGGSFAYAIVGIIVYIIVGLGVTWVASIFVPKSESELIGYVVTGLITLGGLLYTIRKEFNFKEYLQKSGYKPDLTAPTMEAVKVRIRNQYQSGNFFLEQFHMKITREYQERTSKIEALDLLDGVEFEEFIGRYFARTGYKVSMTKASGDDGVDLIVQKAGIKTAVQCKRYLGNVGVSAVQEVYAGKDLYDCDAAIVLTNSYFTKPATVAAKKLGVVLWDRDRLIKELSNTQEDTEWQDFIQSYYDFAPHEEQKATVIELRNKVITDPKPIMKKTDYDKVKLYKEPPPIEKISDTAKLTQFRQCDSCGTTNKVDLTQFSRARCGNCKQPLTIINKATAK
jgi:restriction system protein